MNPFYIKRRLKEMWPKKDRKGGKSNIRTTGTWLVDLNDEPKLIN